MPNPIRWLYQRFHWSRRGTTLRELESFTIGVTADGEANSCIINGEIFTIEEINLALDNATGLTEIHFKGHRRNCTVDFTETIPTEDLRITRNEE